MHHSIEMEDKRKKHRHRDACQVERAQVHGGADLLLAAACEHTWKLKVEAAKIITALISQDYYP
jgi:hypothetical protein